MRVFFLTQSSLVNLTAASVAQTVNTQIKIAALYAVSTEVSAHLVVIGGIYRLTLVYGLVSASRILRVVIDFVVKFFIRFFIFFVIRF